MQALNEERRDAQRVERIDEGKDKIVNPAVYTPEADTEVDDSDGELRPVTVRFTRGAWEAIRDIAAENGVSQAELVRIAVAGNLSAYLGTIRIVDTEQAGEIKEAILSLLGTFSKIENELHRIGVNYNQEVMLENIRRKYAGRTSLDSFIQKCDEEDKVKATCRGFSREDMDALIERYEAATKQVGDILCRILA